MMQTKQRREGSFCVGRCLGQGAQAFLPTGLAPGLVKCRHCPLIMKAAAPVPVPALPVGARAARPADPDPHGESPGGLWTIGYEGRALPQLLALLREAGVQVVLDVRWDAISRVLAYGEGPLRRAVLASGMNYRHLAALGSPPALRRHLEADGNTAAFFAAYRGYLAESEPAQRPLREVTDLLSKRRICLLCRERDPHRCHRSVVAEVLAAQTGLLVEHL